MEISNYNESIIYTERIIDDVGTIYRNVIIDVKDLYILLDKLRNNNQKKYPILNEIVEKIENGKFLLDVEYVYLDLVMSYGWEHYGSYTNIRGKYVLYFRMHKKHYRRKSA